MQMMPEKIAEVKSKLKKGEPEGEIKEQLKRDGYTEEEISKAFPVNQYDMRMWYLFFGICVSLFGLYNIIMGGGFLFLLLGGLLLYGYFEEIKRLHK